MFQKLMEMMFLTMTMGKMGPVMTQAWRPETASRIRVAPQKPSFRPDTAESISRSMKPYSKAIDSAIQDKLNQYRDSGMT